MSDAVRRASGVSRAHVVVGALIAIGLPGASFLGGNGRLAYTMFADVAEVRVRIVATRPDGSTRELSPTKLAREAGGTLGLFFAGTETFRFGPRVRTARVVLGDVAAFACARYAAILPAGVREAPPRDVEIVLAERDREGSPETEYRGRRACP